MTTNSIHIASLVPGSADRATLEKIVEEHPYYTAALVKLLMELKARGDEHGVASLLPKVAAMVPDRTVLKKHLESVTMRMQEKAVEASAASSPESASSEHSEEEVKTKDSEMHFDNEMQTETKPADPEAKGIDEKNEDEPLREVETGAPELKKEAHSFTEWLHLVQGEKKKVSTPDTEENQTGETEELEEEILIDRTAATAAAYQLEAARLEEEEARERAESEEEESDLSEDDLQSARDLAAQSLAMDESLITETLATVYQIQGKKEKAIQIYERLILKIPEKSAYFAAQIKKLKGE